MRLINSRAEIVEKRLLRIQGRYKLSDPCVGKLKTLIDLLEVDQHASTSVRSSHEAVDTHIADSLVGLDVEELRNARAVVDIGCGAGFPGLPLATVNADSRYELLDASERKLGFVRRVKKQLELENVRLIYERAELWASAEGACRYQAALSRAVSALPIMLEYAAPLLDKGGILIAWQGRRDYEEETHAAAAAEVLRMEVEQVLSVKPYPGSKNRHLHVYRKVDKTPDKYPRRAGMAVKRPLGQR